MGIHPNSAKRTQNENVPPTLGSSRVLNVKSVVSRVSRTSRTLRDGQHRKRSENLTGVQTSKHIVDQAKRRQSKNKIRFTIKSLPANKIKDVEMADGTAVQPPTKAPPILLPLELSRPPEYKAVTPAMIAAVDSTYEDMNVQYFRDGLQVLEKELVQSLRSVKIDNQKTTLPNELNVVVNDSTLILPSHILAIFGQAPAPGSSTPRQVTLYPVHSLVLIAHCTGLPLPPPTIPPPEHVNGEQTVQLPVWKICLPSPQTYPVLSMYLYSKDTQRLMSSMLPRPAPEDLRVARGRTREFGEQLGRSFPAAVIVRYTFLIHGLWQNVYSMGIFDQDLWDALDAIWNTALVALSVATGDASMAIAPYQPLSDEGYESAEEDHEDVEAGPSGEGSSPSPLSEPSSSTSSAKDKESVGAEPCGSETSTEPITRAPAASESKSPAAI